MRLAWVTFFWHWTNAKRNFAYTESSDCKNGSLSALSKTVFYSNTYKSARKEVYYSKSTPIWKIWASLKRNSRKLTKQFDTNNETEIFIRKYLSVSNQFQKVPCFGGIECVMATPLLTSMSPIFFIERCLESNPECCRSKQANIWSTIKIPIASESTLYSRDPIPSTVRTHL